MTKNTKIPKVISNKGKKIEPNFIPEDEQWNWQKFLVPELYSSISDLLAVREPNRFKFFEDLKKFIKTWKKENK